MGIFRQTIKQSLRISFATVEEDSCKTRRRKKWMNSSGHQDTSKFLHNFALSAPGPPNPSSRDIHPSSQIHIHTHTHTHKHNWKMTCPSTHAHTHSPCVHTHRPGRWPCSLHTYTTHTPHTHTRTHTDLEDGLAFHTHTPHTHTPHTHTQTKAQTTQDTGCNAQCDASKWGLLM